MLWTQYQQDKLINVKTSTLWLNWVYPRNVKYALILAYCKYNLGFPQIIVVKVLVVKDPPSNAGAARDTISIPVSGRTPGGGHGNPLQYSCLENPKDRGAWWATQSIGLQRIEQNWSNLACLYELTGQNNHEYNLTNEKKISL